MKYLFRPHKVKNNYKRTINSVRENSNIRKLKNIVNEHCIKEEI